MYPGSTHLIEHLVKMTLEEKCLLEPDVYCGGKSVYLQLLGLPGDLKLKHAVPLRDGAGAVCTVLWCSGTWWVSLDSALPRQFGQTTGWLRLPPLAKLISCGTESWLKQPVVLAPHGQHLFLPFLSSLPRLQPSAVCTVGRRAMLLLKNVAIKKTRLLFFQPCVLLKRPTASDIQYSSWTLRWGPVGFQCLRVISGNMNAFLSIIGIYWAGSLPAATIFSMRRPGEWGRFWPTKEGNFSEGLQVFSFFKKNFFFSNRN